MRGKAVVLLAVVFASASVVAGGDAQGDLKKFAGTWSVESAQKGGKEGPERDIKELRFVFSGDKLTLKFGEKAMEGSFKIDPSKKPRQFDITLKDKTGQGIYRFKGDKLELCISDPDGGEARPTEFKSAEGSRTILFLLKRETK
jgi:uncharacterized protein (TIGR03067 family)